MSVAPERASNSHPHPLYVRRIVYQVPGFWCSSILVLILCSGFAAVASFSVFRVINLDPYLVYEIY